MAMVAGAALRRIQSSSFLRWALSMLHECWLEHQHFHAASDDKLRMCTLSEDCSTDSKEFRYARLERARASETLDEAVDKLERGGAADADLATYASLLRRCGIEKALLHGKRVHAHIVSSGQGGSTFLGNLLVQMYGKCGSLRDACAVFDQLEDRNLFSWSIMLAAYVQTGQSRKALKLFRDMDCQGVKPNGVTFVSVIGACCRLEALTEGKEAHARVTASGFGRDIAVGNSLLTMYAKCGLVAEARRVFDEMYMRNVVSWNSMIVAYAQQGHPREAIELFKQMEPRGLQPDRVTFIGVLSACSSSGALEEGKAIHARIPVDNYVSDFILGTALVNMYSKAGSLAGARRVFDQMQRKDVVSWAAMVAAYAQNGHGKEALQLFHQMDQQGQGAAANEVTFVSVLDACSEAGDLAEGKRIHSRIASLGFEAHVAVGNTLLNMYSKHGSLEDAKRLFDNKPERDVVSWNAMIVAYTRHGHGKKAVKLLQHMDMEGVKPDEITLTGIFDACADTGALVAGRKFHARIRDSKVESDITVGNSIINMYSRCWSLLEAESMYQRMKHKDLITWNSLIAAYAMHGLASEALELFQELNVEGHTPDEFTFTSTLFACSHAGLLEPGWKHFLAMVGDHSAKPATAHYGCMIDLLGRVGRLNEAEDLIKTMPLEPDSVAWMTLLGACRTHSDAKKAAKCADELLELEPGKAAAYVMLNNVYAALGRSKDPTKLQSSIEESQETESSTDQSDENVDPASSEAAL